MTELGKWLVAGGILLATVGAFLWLGWGKSWLGKLPGDIHYSKENFSFHFPIMTCGVLSLLFSLILWLARR